MALDYKILAEQIEINLSGKFFSESPEINQFIIDNGFNSDERIQNRSNELYIFEVTFKNDLGTIKKYPLLGFSSEGKSVVNKKIIEFDFQNTLNVINRWENESDELYILFKALKKKLNIFLEHRAFFSDEEIELIEIVINHKNISDNDYLKLIQKILSTKHNIHYKQTGYLDKVSINSYFSIEGLGFQGLADYKEIYFVGENGDGKTLLLQALLIGLKWGELNDKSTNKELIGRITQYRNENQSFALSIVDEKNLVYGIGNDTKAMRNVFAYGANRNQSSAENYDPLGYLTLFHEDKFLRSPTQWLKDLKLEESSNKNGLKVNKAIELLEEVLDNNVKIIFEGSRVVFKERNTESLRFDQLSDGYRSVMTMVADLLSRLATNQPHVISIHDYVGIVLIDELSLHLHPKWEEKIVLKLRTWFPKIQFFITTHSPIMILSAGRDAVFYRVYKEKENGETKISQPFYCSEMSDLMINSIITSPLFDLDNVLMHSFNPKKDDLDTSFDGYLSNRIRKKVEEEIKKKKDTGRVYISPDEIDAIIEETLTLNKNGKL